MKQLGHFINPFHSDLVESFPFPFRLRNKKKVEEPAGLDNNSTRRSVLYIHQALTIGPAPYKVKTNAAPFLVWSQLDLRHQDKNLSPGMRNPG
jgi:hypothetical protein